MRGPPDDFSGTYFTYFFKNEKYDFDLQINYYEFIFFGAVFFCHELNDERKNCNYSEIFFGMLNACAALLTIFPGHILRILSKMKVGIYNLDKLL